MKVLKLLDAFLIRIAKEHRTIAKEKKRLKKLKNNLLREIQLPRSRVVIEGLTQ